MYCGVFTTVSFDPDSVDAFSRGLFCSSIFVVDSFLFLMFFFQTDGMVTNTLLIVTCDIELSLK